MLYKQLDEFLYEQLKRTWRSGYLRRADLVLPRLGLMNGYRFWLNVLENGHRLPHDAKSAYMDLEQAPDSEKVERLCDLLSSCHINHSLEHHANNDVVIVVPIANFCNAEIRVILDDYFRLISIHAPGLIDSEYLLTCEGVAYLVVEILRQQTWNQPIIQATDLQEVNFPTHTSTHSM